MKTLTIYAAAIFAATITQGHAQDDLDNLKGNLPTSTPAPAATATPKPAAVTQAPAATPAAPRTATTTTPKATPAPAAVAPREDVKTQLAHGHFITGSDLPNMAGKKVQPGTFLVGQWKATGSISGGRKEFTDAGFFGGGKTKLLIRFPVAPDARVLVAGSSTKWERPAPLRVESVSSTKEGVTVYATDVTP